MPEPAPRRIFCREWKWNKPHLPKSTSLPILRLTPVDRPIFLCRRCGFINTLIPLCLWCRWTSETAKCDYELSMPRIRRASAPPRVFWKQATVSTSPSRFFHTLTTYRQVTNPTTTQFSLSVASLKHLESSDNPTKRAVPIFQDSGGRKGQGCLSDHMGSRRRHKLSHHRDAPTDGDLNSRTVTDVTKATAPSLTSVFDKPLRTIGSHESLLKDRITGGNSTRYHRSPIPNFPDFQSELERRPLGVDRPNAMHVIKTLSKKSLRSNHIVIDFNAIHESYDIIKLDDASPKPHDDIPPTQRTLRRKKRISLFRTSSPPPETPDATATPVSQRPQSNSQLTSLQIPNQEPVTRTHVRSKSQPHNAVRLGHPSRPYYTAIRPNMSPPTSAIEPVHPMAQTLPSSQPSRPLSLPSPSRAPSPGVFSVFSSNSALSAPLFEEDPPRTSFSYPSSSASVYDHVSQRPFTLGGSMSRHRSGFSVSGEVELRMALAREQGNGRCSPDDAYQFRDMTKKQYETRVMRKMHDLKQGLKDLIIRKMP